MIPIAPLIASMLLPLPALAHQVEHALSSAPLPIVTLRYADDKPFAYEAYEIVADEGGPPLQVGRTDAQGRVAVLPVPGKALILTASAKDGHGARIRIPASAAAIPEMANAPPRWLPALAGLGLLFGLFGLYQFHLRQRKSSQ